MKPATLRAWDVVHRWTSLVCTAFMLLLCLTGLPLVFRHEIDHLLGATVEAPVRADDTARVPLDRVVATAQARHPRLHPLFASQEPDEARLWFVTLGADATLAQVAVDARDGSVVGEPIIGGRGVMSVVRSLHIDLFAGQPGKLFLGAMGLLLIASIVSGVVLYAPFMRKLEFGTVRRHRARRVRWLDLHNLIGIVTLTWASVVGFTGVVNTWAELVVGHWRTTELAAMLHDAPASSTTAPVTLDASTHAVLDRVPDSKIAFIAFPGSSFSGPRHYAYFLRGATPLTSRLLTPVVVDAANGAIVGAGAAPWYLAALQLSQPLHFGDYGGWPMQVLWAALDIATIVVLCSGLYLWIARRSRGPVRHGRAVLR